MLRRRLLLYAVRGGYRYLRAKLALLIEHKAHMTTAPGVPMEAKKTVTIGHRLDATTRPGADFRLWRLSTLSSRALPVRVTGLCGSWQSPWSCLQPLTLPISLPVGKLPGAVRLKTSAPLNMVLP